MARLSRIALFLMTVLICIASSFGATEAKFQIAKGINLSGWFEVKTLDSIRRDTFYTESKLLYLKELGFDHVRIPVRDENLFRDDGAFVDDNWKVLINALEFCKKIDLKVVFDLHWFRLNDVDNASLFDSVDVEQDWDGFGALWERIQEKLIRFPTSFLAYEILNEPKVPKNYYKEWNIFAKKWIDRVRKKEPDRMLFVSTASNYSKFWTAKFLKLPKDENLGIVIHYYEPAILGHYKETSKSYFGDIHYPGVTIPETFYKTLSLDEQKKYASFAKKNYDRNQIRKDIMTALRVAKNGGYSLYVSEYGCTQFVPEDMKYQYLNDVTGVFNELGVPHSMWGGLSRGYGLKLKDGSIDAKKLKNLNLR